MRGLIAEVVAEEKATARATLTQNPYQQKQIDKKNCKKVLVRIPGMHSLRKTCRKLCFFVFFSFVLLSLLVLFLCFVFFVVEILVFGNYGRIALGWLSTMYAANPNQVPPSATSFNFLCKHRQSSQTPDDTRSASLLGCAVVLLPIVNQSGWKIESALGKYPFTKPKLHTCRP